MKIDLKFSLRDKVEIPELKRNGKVTGILIVKDGISYRVRYFDNAKAEEIYFDEDEIKKI